MFAGIYFCDLKIEFRQINPSQTLMNLQFLVCQFDSLNSIFNSQMKKSLGDEFADLPWKDTVTIKIQSLGLIKHTSFMQYY